MHNLKECPFCEEIRKLSIKTGSFMNIESFYVNCDRCLAKGPSGFSEQDAIDKWNGDSIYYSPSREV